MKYVLDRVEEGIAVLLPLEKSAGRILVPADHLPPGCREGDILTMTLERDPAAAATVKDRVSQLIEKMREKK